MTAQIGDTVKFRDASYEIIWVEHPESFNVDWSKYGVKPKMCSTACWRGYYCHYEANEDGMLLKDAYIYCGDKEEDYPAINGVEVDPATGHMVDYTTFVKGKLKNLRGLEADYNGHRRYRNLNLPVMYKDKPYTGKLRIAKDFLPQYYIHMGLQKWFAFKTTLELTYENGILKDVKDISKEAKKMRADIDSGKCKYEDEDAMIAEDISLLDRISDKLHGPKK